jgi:hypothetical protein
MIVCDRCKTECSHSADLNFGWFARPYGVAAHRSLFKGDLCQLCKDNLLLSATCFVEIWLKNEQKEN